MSTVTTSRAPSTTRPSTRTVRIISGLCGENAGTISITAGKLVTHYEAWRNDTAFGDCWELTKIENGKLGDKYNVLLAGQESNCDCAGWTYCDHCKHVDALMALQNRGLLS